MKKLFMVLCFVSAVAIASGAAVPAPQTPAILTDNSGGDTRTNPLSVAITSSTISISAAASPVTNGSTTVYTPTAVPLQVTIATDACALFAVATGTFEVYLGSTTVMASSAAVYNVSLDTAEGQIIMLGQTATPTNVTVHQLSR